MITARGLKANLEVLYKPLLLLEDVLELSQSGLHLFKGELLFSFCSTILGNPGVEFIDSVVQKLPFLDQGIGLLHPFTETSLTFLYLSLSS